VRGAFTGAVRDKKGRFELAHGGTIFLDEVGELSPGFQVKLLRVLEDKSFVRVGAEQTVRVDVRVVSATNRDLRVMVREGRFREDLFYRLCVVPIDMPPLRDRPGDLPLLVEHSLERIARETGSAIRAVSDEAMSLLLAYGWPGNVRELVNALQYATVRCSGDEILASHLPLEIRESAGPVRPARRLIASRPARPGRRPKLTRRAVEDALARTGGNKRRAAELLGVGRATLYRFLKNG
jgi:transcriptional regulator with PAS, ATPase and Fis domain